MTPDGRLDGLPEVATSETALRPDQLDGLRTLVTGASRGIGAATARLLASAGARVVVNYRNKESRALRLVTTIIDSGGEATAIRADLTDPDAVTAMLAQVHEAWGGLDLLVMNASGGMEADMPPEYATLLNRDAQVTLLEKSLSLLGAGSRVVFLTSHQAHFLHARQSLSLYEPIARSKRAGEDALRQMLPQLDQRSIGFVVVSGDMIEGTVTALLLDRAHPGAIDARRDDVGKLYDVEEFAAEVVRAAIEPIPVGQTRFVGDVSSFLR